MTLAMAFVLAVMVAAVILFLTEWVRVDLVAILVLLALAIGGVISHEQALAGFSNRAVITVAAVLVLGAGLMRTGIANLVGRQVRRLAGDSEARLLVATMIIVGALSGFMNNIGVAALLLPVILDTCRRSNRAPSKLLMPLAFASLLGGLTTLIGTAPNILISGALSDAGLRPFGLLEFTPVGVLALLLGTIYMLLVGRRILPDRDMAAESDEPALELQDAYGLRKRLGAMTVPASSALCNKTLAESRLGSALGINVVAITRKGRTRLAPGADSMLRADDKLLVEGRLDTLNALRGWRHLVLDSAEWSAARLAETTIDLAEIRVPADSPLVGSSLLEKGFRRKFGVNVLAARRGDRLEFTGLATRPIEAGDAFLVQGAARRLRPLDDAFDGYRTVGTDEAAHAYRLHEHLMAVRVPEGSLLVGQMLAESRLGNAFDMTVLGVFRAGQDALAPDPAEEFHVDDTLLVLGRPDDLLTVQGIQGLQVHDSSVPAASTIESDDVRLVEFLLAPESRMAGKTLREMRFRERFGLTVVAIWSEGYAHRSNLRDRPVRIGDVLLVHGDVDKLANLRGDPDFLSLRKVRDEEVDEAKAPLGAAIMGGVVLAVLTGTLPIHIAAPAGAALMVLTRCLTMEDAYRYIEWKAVILIAGMLSLGAAMAETGAATLLAESLIQAVGHRGPLAVLSAVFWFTALAAQVMPTAAVAVLVSPIALSAATDMAINPHAIMMAVAIAASSAFMSPVGHPVNLMVMGLGGYRFADYSRVGAGLVVINFLIALLLVPLLFPFA